MRILKTAIPTLLLSVLSGCATTMTPLQQSSFAKNYTLLNLCSERGLMNPNLAANGLAYYRRMLGSKYDADSLNQEIDYFYQIHEPYINPYDCNQFSVSLQADMIESQRAAQALLDYSNAMESLGESMRKTRTTCYTDALFGTVRCTSF